MKNFLSCLAIFCLAGSSVQHNPNCCCCQHPVVQQEYLWWPSVADKLECFAFVNFGERPKLVPSVPPTISSAIEKGETTEVWIRHVFYDDLLKPVQKRKVKVCVVDSFGDVEDENSLNRSEVSTTRTGFNLEPLKFTAPNKPGVFRIRVEYKDKNANSFSYSPPIIVR